MLKPSLRILALLFTAALAVAACSDDDAAQTDAAGSTESGGDETATTAPAETDAESGESDEGSDVAAAPKPDVSITAVSFTNATVTIRNNGDTELSLDGMFMCNRPNYAGLPDETVAPGATHDVDVTALNMGSASGEYALYTSNDFGNSDAIVAYVQWGSGENGRSSVAVEAGLIAEGDFVENQEADFSTE